MKAILVIDIPDDYQEYGSGDWYVMGDDLSIVYEEDGALMNYRYIDDDMAQLKPMPEFRDEHYKSFNIELSQIINSENRGYNDCLREILGEEE